MSTLADLQTVVYDDCPYTSFPRAVDTFARKADVSLSTKSLVDTYYNLIAINDFAGAGSLINANPTLKQVIVTQEDINKLRDGLIAVERVFNSYVAEYIAAVVQSKGTWNASTTYEKYNVVTYTYRGLERTYIALPQDETVVQIPTGTRPVGGSTSAQYWVCITHEGIQGASGTGLSPRGAYLNDVTYSKDDLVVSNGYLYVANEDNIVGEAPSASSTKWTLLSLNSVSDQVLGGVTIAVGDWNNKAYRFDNANITADTVVEVYFNKDSMDSAAQSGIYVTSNAGYIQLVCADDTPTESIVVDYFRIRNDITG